MRINLWLWYPVMKGWASLNEVQTQWSMLDVVKANILIEASRKKK